LPIVFIKNITNDIILGLWKIKEPKSFFVEKLGSHLIDNSKPINPAENVGLHWFASRYLLEQLFKASSIEIHKNENNKPTLFIDNNKYYVSISHSFEYVGIMFSKHHELGFDIEKIDTRIERVAHKFLNNNEQLFAQNIITKTLIWSAKESVYKWYGKKELDFKLHMEMQSFTEKNEGEFICILNKNELKIEIPVNYFLIDNYVFTFCFQ
jgi:4'-phosphopantetheinyl transferase